MSKSVFGAGALALLLGSAAPAQTIDVRAGRLIDPASAKVLTDQRIRIIDGKIASVAPWRAGDGPAGLDWSGYTVLPGLIDLHTHLADGYGESSDPGEPLRHSEAATILKGAEAARTELRAGFTTVRDVGVYRGLTDVALRDAIAAGEVEGPRMFVAGGYITTPGGGGEIDALAPDVPVPQAFRLGEVHDAAEARDRARYFLDHGADFIKLIATGAVLAVGSEPGALELSPEEMKAACDEAKLRGSYCIAHAHGTEGIKAAIRAGARTIEHASYLDAEGIALAKARGVWLDMDIYNGDWINEVGTKEGWPAEYLRKNIETTDVQPARVRRRRQSRCQTDFRHRRGGLSLRSRRAAIRLHGALRNDPDAGDPVGHQRSRAGARQARAGRERCARRVRRPRRGQGRPAARRARP